MDDGSWCGRSDEGKKSQQERQEKNSKSMWAMMAAWMRCEPWAEGEDLITCIEIRQKFPTEEKGR